MFIAIDGIDGAGKTSQIELMTKWLQSKGHNVKNVRDPGTTAVGESIRDILLHREEIPLAPTTEMLLYMSARAQLVAEQIQPALTQKSIVISDRFLLSNVVYQGYGHGLDVDQIWNVGACAIQGTRPDVTILLDLPVDAAFERIQRSQDRLEKRGKPYFERIREGFLREVRRASPNALIIPASGSIDEVHNRICRELEPLVNS